VLTSTLFFSTVHIMADEPKKEETCPKCGKEMSDIITTPTGKKLQRCTGGTWNAETRKTEGCAYVKWHQDPPQELDEQCPTCGKPLVMMTTRFGKKLKKCSTGGWDREAKKPTGCPYVEWITGTTKELDEDCPECGEKLVLYTTARGKKMKKCSTSGWDREKKQATGCTYVEWLNDKKPASTENAIPVAEPGEEPPPDEEPPHPAEK
jgi:ssDNA-binding Zn-finger/Zn-ribbon topoisomerase 1